MRDLQNISNTELALNLERLCFREREILSEVLTHLAEVDRRKLYLGLGYSSLFSYSVSALKYSEPQAQRRISSARCVARFPEVINLLLEKRLSLTSISLISSHLTEVNYKEILALVVDKTSKEVEELVTKYKPALKVKESIKPIPASPPPLLLEPRTAEPKLNLRSEGKNEPCHLVSNSEPVKEIRYEVKFSVNKRVLDKLNRVKALSKKAYNLETLFESLLDSHLKELEPKKAPRKVPPRSRVVPKALKRAVSERDKHRCAFISPEGKRCEEKLALQFDHITPLAKGGITSADNLRLLCPAHNLYEAKRVLGEKFIRKFIE